MKYTLFTLMILTKVTWTFGGPQDTTRIGIFVTSIYDLDYLNNSYSIEFWLWRVNHVRDVHDSQHIYIANAKETSILYASSDLKDQKFNIIPIANLDTLFWTYSLIKATIKHEFDISNFPFDNENLQLVLEEDIYNSQDLYLNVDTKQSGLSKSIQIQNWKIDSLNFKNTEAFYKTSFGNPRNNSPNSYSSVKFLIPIKRDSGSMFWKLLSGLFVSFIISLFSLKININEADARFGTCVGGLFAAIANMYIVNSNLPMISKFTFLDELHIMTFFFILILFITSTSSLKFHRQGNDKKSKLLDNIVFYGLLTIYFITVIILLP